MCGFVGVDVCVCLVGGVCMCVVCVCQSLGSHLLLDIIELLLQLLDVSVAERKIKKIGFLLPPVREISLSVWAPRHSP
jgi:hypothetical protein